MASRQLVSWLHQVFWNLVRRICLVQLRYVFARPMKVSPRGALVFSPHQDDETLGCGGLIALKRQQDAAVHVAFLTDGSRGCSEDSCLTPDQLAEVRTNESLAALHVLGLPASSVTFLGAPDGALSSLSPAREEELLLTLEELLVAFDPAEVYLPFRGDQHDDHRATYHLVMKALGRSGRRPLILQYPIWALERPWRSGWGWLELSNLRYVRIDAALPLKQTALARYRSQLVPQPPHGRQGLPPEFLELFLKNYELYLPTREGSCSSPVSST